MNIIKHVVTDVISDPYSRTYDVEGEDWHPDDEFTIWCVEVLSNSYGCISKQELSFETLEEAEEVEEGYTYHA